MVRLAKYRYVINSSVVSKQAIFILQIPKLHLKLIAGLYKPAALKLEHGLILTSVAGNLPIFRYQLHGKRQKRTVSLNNEIASNNLLTLDKIIHEMLPKIPDFLTPKMKKPATANYSLSLNQKSSPLPDYEDLLSHSLYSDHKGIFLPLRIHVYFSKAPTTSVPVSTQYIRMMRLPLTFYRKRKAPAFDDPVIFNQNY